MINRKKINTTQVREELSTVLEMRETTCISIPGKTLGTSQLTQTKDTVRITLVNVPVAKVDQNGVLEQVTHKKSYQLSNCD